MNHGEWMVVTIVAIVMIARTCRGGGRFGNWRSDRTDRMDRRDRGDRMPFAAQDSAENQRLRDEVRALKNRIQVLERIATDSSSSLDREIESLRDRH
jgi:hypothetical protein